MRVIGVVDLLAGRAVHARAGRRESYAPVRAVAGSSIEPGDALALARAYVDRLGLTELYAADLDAILGRRVPGRPATDASSQDTLVAAVAALGAPLWLDAGVSSRQSARVTRSASAPRTSSSGSRRCRRTTRSERSATRSAATASPSASTCATGSRSSPRAESGGIPPGEPAHRDGRARRRAGAGAVIVIDLARVGTGAGLDLALIARVREAAPGLTLLAGGGVRGLDDLARLADAGCDGALVATALHDGRLGRGDVAARSPARSRHPSAVERRRCALRQPANDDVPDVTRGM